MGEFIYSNAIIQKTETILQNHLIKFQTKNTLMMWKRLKNSEFLSQFGTLLFLVHFCFLEGQIIIFHSDFSLAIESLKGSQSHFSNPFLYYIFGWVDNDQTSILSVAVPYQNPCSKMTVKMI